MIKVFSAAALVAGMATASFAGSVDTVITEVDTVFAPAPSSAGLALPIAIGVGVVAVGLLLANDDDDAVAATTEIPNS